LWTALVLKEDHEHRFTSAEIEQLNANLIKATYNAAINEGGCPKMEGVNSASGRFIVKCADQYTVDWLHQKASSMGCGGKAIEAILESDLTKHTRCTMWVPDLVGTPNNRAATLALLKAQNSGLLTDRWAVYSELKKERGRLFVVGVDKESYNAIKSVGHQLYYGVSKVAVRAAKAQTGEADGTSKANQRNGQ
jgi:hypothetical protein